MADRTICLVPFCKHWTTRSKTKEWICAPHWRDVPAVRKRVYRRACKRYEAIMARAIQRTDGQLDGIWVDGQSYVKIDGRWTTWSTDAEWEEHRQASRAGWRLWQRLKRMAIERAAGI